MKREGMLKRLQNVDFGVELVALTSEDALERTFINSKGFAYDWVSFDEPWPAIKITDLTNEQLNSIKDKLRNKSLSKDDLKGTQLLSMFEETGNNGNICDAFIGLQNVVFETDNTLFALYDMECNMPIYTFYTDYALFVKAFEERYMRVDAEWQDLSDEDLMSWIDRLEYEFSDVPLCEYNTNEVND